MKKSIIISLLFILLIISNDIFAQHYLGVFRNSTGARIDSVYLPFLHQDSLWHNMEDGDSIIIVRLFSSTFVDSTRLAWSTDDFNRGFTAGQWIRGFRASNASGDVGQYTANLVVWKNGAFDGTRAVSRSYSYTVQRDPKGDGSDTTQVVDTTKKGGMNPTDIPKFTNNLVTNPSFDNTDSAGAILGWHNTVDVTIMQRNARRSGRFGALSFGSAISARSDSIHLPAGTNVRLSATMWATSTSSRISLVDLADASIIDLAIPAAANARTWGTITKEKRIAATNYYRVLLKGGGAPSDSLMSDDIALVAAFDTIGVALTAQGVDSVRAGAIDSNSYNNNIKQPFFGRIDAGTAQAIAANSITLRAGAPSDSLRGAWVTIQSATTGTHETRLIAAYNGISKLANISDNWAVTPSGTITYIVHRGFGGLTAGLVYPNTIGASELASDAVDEIADSTARKNAFRLYGIALNAKNLLVNPDFEIQDSAGAPYGWRVFGGSGAAVVTQVKALTGKWSYYNRNDVAVNKTISLRFWAPAGKLHYGVAYYDSGGNSGGLRISINDTIPANAAFDSLLLTRYNMSGGAGTPGNFNRQSKIFYNPTARPMEFTLGVGTPDTVYFENPFVIFEDTSTATVGAIDSVRAVGSVGRFGTGPRRLRIFVLDTTNNSAVQGFVVQVRDSATNTIWSEANTTNASGIVDFYVLANTAYLPKMAKPFYRVTAFDTLFQVGAVDLTDTVLVAGIALAAPPAGGQISVEGNVYDITGDSLQGATVTFTLNQPCWFSSDDTTNLIAVAQERSATSNINGKFTISIYPTTKLLGSDRRMAPKYAITCVLPDGTTTMYTEFEWTFSHTPGSQKLNWNLHRWKTE